MAELQSWRCHTHTVRATEKLSIHHSRIADVTQSGTLDFTWQGADESKRRPRPTNSFASFASYLGTHQCNDSPSSTPEWPVIDWSNINSLNDKDGVYKPDTELMCTAITQQMLANPSVDLPAHYSTFVLHLIEAYRQSKADVEYLKLKLAEEIACNHTTSDESNGQISPWSLEKTQLLQNPEKAKRKTLYSKRPQGPVKKVVGARLQKQCSTVQTPKSSVDYENNDRKRKQAEETRGNSGEASRWRYADLG